MNHLEDCDLFYLSYSLLNNQEVVSYINTVHKTEEKNQQFLRFSHPCDVKIIFKKSSKYFIKFRMV